MSPELASEGSVQTGNSADSNAASLANGSEGRVQDWTAGLQDEDNRRTVQSKGWKSPDDPIRSYRELEGKMGQSLTPPKPDDPPEAWDKVYDKLGRPKAPDEYQFKIPEGLPEQFPYDDKSASKFKTWAHKAGLNPTQAQHLHDEFVRDMAGQLGQHQEAETQAVTAAHNDLVKVWGNPEGEQYKRNVELATRTIRQNGLGDELKRIGAVTPTGDVKAPKLAKFLAEAGEKLYAEDALYGGNSSGGPNPFKDGGENLTQQGQIIRSDPDHARTLIRLAGKDPARWGFK